MHLQATDFGGDMAYMTMILVTGAAVAAEV